MDRILQAAEAPEELTLSRESQRKPSSFSDSRFSRSLGQSSSAFICGNLRRMFPAYSQQHFTKQKTHSAILQLTISMEETPEEAMKALLAVIVLCAAAFAQNEAAIAKAKAACGPDAISFNVKTSEGSHPTETVEAGKALIYLIGQDLTGCSGCGKVVRIGLDGSWAGAIDFGSYTSFTVEPGEHHLCTNWQSFFASNKKPVGLANFAAEAGKTYYFRIRAFAFHQVFVDIDPVNADEGIYLVASSSMSKSYPKKPD